MPDLLLTLILHAWLLSAAAVCFATVLVGDGMLLAPVQAAWRAWYRRRYGAELDAAWWAKPVWLCFACVAGQWAFWGYLLSRIDWQWPALVGYDPLHHLYFTSLTILLAAGWRAAYAFASRQ